MHLEKKLIWDISLDSYQYPAEIKEILFKKHLLLRKSYTKWIGQISKKFSKDIDWWSSIPASRNTNFSNMFKIIITLETIKNIEHQNIEIKTDSIIIYNLIKKHFKRKNIKVFLINKKKSKNYLINFFIPSIFQLLIFLIIKIFYKKKKIDKINNVFISTYPTYNLNKNERLFQFSNLFLKKNYKKFFFIPTFLPHKNFLNILKTISQLNKKNYFFKESLISFKDLFFAFKYPFRIKKFDIKFKKFNKYDLSKLLFEEINNFRYYNSTLQGILNYKFVKKLYQKKYKVKKAVCWLENHEQKGWNYGFRKFFPSSSVYGYQGFTNLPQLMNTIPSNFEEKFKVIPKKIIVSGKSYLSARKEFYPKLKIEVGPSLIYNNIHQKFIKKNKIQFLVILTEIFHINLNILDWLKHALNKDKNIIFYIKKPKILNMDHYINKLNKNKNMIFCNGNLVEFLKKTNFVITSGPTSATIESLGYNCKLLIPLIDPYDKIYLKSIMIPRHMYEILKNKDEFFKSIKLKNFSKKTQRLNPSQLLSLFEKVSTKNQDIFI